MNAINNITIGHPERLRKPVGYTMLANLVNIFPFMLSIEAVNVLFKAYDGSGTGLDTTRLWWICGLLAVYMIAMALAERASFRHNFRSAYAFTRNRQLKSGSQIAGNSCFGSSYFRHLCRRQTL